MKNEKKKYTKPSLKKNDPLVNITFATAAATTGTATTTTPPGTAIPGTGGSVAPAVGP